ncbi:tyrosine-type recombinase/integrase [Catenuloplanes sp. NPDC051500]|uniref:tyrosine-type recombinase/integrase n=1 Tax=Catenuloplanes sp. NPDC051500 TaxID=3363959 RepID=UPI0037B0F25B
MAFDEKTGLPEPMARALNTRSWYAHAIAFVDVKWAQSSAKHRIGIAETMATVTPALFGAYRPTKRSGPSSTAGAFNKARRDAGPPPEHLASAVRWLESHTVDSNALTDAALVRKVLDTLALRMDGRAAAPAMVNRKRAVFSGCLKYAVELRLLDFHPLTLVSWTAPKNSDQVDRRSVVNPEQARRLLAEVPKIAPELEAFFSCMYYAALRPEEVLALRDDEYERTKKKGGWGTPHLTGSIVAVGKDWGAQYGSAAHRGLKHQAASATRDVPAAPVLCTLLETHIKEYPPSTSGRIFVTRRGSGGRSVPTAGQPIPNNTYTTVFRKAREAAMTPAQLRSPLARVPYQLRHACVSLWLNAAVPATLVAEWAGHSVYALLKIYASCIYGRRENSTAAY